MGLLSDINLMVLNVNLDVANRTRKNNDHIFRRQISLFLHGAEGVGKTTTLEKETGKTKESLEYISRTVGKETHLLSDFSFP